MLLDTASLYFRAFYGVPDRRKAPGEPPTNAASGLMDMIARLVREHRPGAVVACWDADWRPPFRVELLASYKAHRVARGDEEEMPDALVEQLPLIEALLVATGMPPVGVTGYEADDVIGTYSDRSDRPVDVVPGARDLFQVVDDARGVRVLYTARGIRNIHVVDDAYVRDKYGVSATQYADMAVLRGDPSDGLPGVPGIGEKTAASLLRTFDDLPGIREAAADPDSALSPRLRSAIIDSAEYLQRAVPVVRVVRDLPVPAAPDQAPRPDAELLAAIGREFGISASVTRIGEALAQISEE
jgi:5'-3' exonuclease